MQDRKKVAIIIAVIIFVVSAVFFLYTQFFSSPAKTDISTSYLQSVFMSIFGVVSDNTVVMPSRTVQPTVPPAGNSNLVGTDAFTQCLTDRGLKMYGIPPCPSCAEQKRLFGNSFQYIYYVDCEKDQTLCEQKQIRGYPTWEFGDGRMVSGIIPLSYFAEQTGCKISES